MKLLMLITAPVSSRSGYGDHARDLFYSFYKTDKFDIKILDVRWGNCPRNALNPDNEIHKKIIDCVLVEPTMDRKPDVYVDIRIPSEFEQHGRFNIGITAGIETNLISSEWINKTNAMDLLIVPSEHSKNGFVNTLYDKVQQLPNGESQNLGSHKVEKPVEVLFEGFDPDIYKKIKTDDIDSDILNKINDMVQEEFAFLFVGQWGNGDYGEDRKDIGRLIKIFCESFANKSNRPGLVLKTNGATFSILDLEDIKHKINVVKEQFSDDLDLPNIYILHGDLTDSEMNSLYNHPKIKAMVSFTHGEGFGRPLLEATAAGLPVITSGWSGHTDFLDPNLSILLPGKLDKIPKAVRWKDILIKESEWFTVDENAAYDALNFTFKNIFDLQRKADSLMIKNKEKFTLDLMTDKLKNILDKYLANLEKPVQLKLPKLKKVGDKKSSDKIKLPKLKRI